MYTFITGININLSYKVQIERTKLLRTFEVGIEFRNFMYLPWTQTDTDVNPKRTLNGQKFNFGNKYFCRFDIAIIYTTGIYDLRPLLIVRSSL